MNVLIEYCGHEISAKPGQTLLSAIVGAGEDHRHICGGHGFCTSCRVEVLWGSDGLSPVAPVERDRLGPEAGHLRLACQTTVVGPAGVRVPRPQSNRFSPDD